MGNLRDLQEMLGCGSVVQNKGTTKVVIKKHMGGGVVFLVIFSAAWVVKRVRWKTIFWVEDSLG